jgi:hypothetical protein
LQRELAHHLEALAAEYVAGGMTPEEARLAALRAFGPSTPVAMRIDPVTALRCE